MDNIYKNRDWLYTAYQTKKLSTHQIAKEVNAGSTTIWNWLYKFNIPTRSKSEGIHLAKANHCNLSQEAKEWIDGELLGDGSLQSENSYSAKFVYGSKYLEYIQYVSDTLKSFEINGGKIRKTYYKPGEKTGQKRDCYCYFYQSLSYAELSSIRKRWYPKGKKIVPKDLELTPLTCRQWYIGDGCLEHDKRTKKGGFYIILYTNGFPVSDVRWLISKLKRLNLKTTRLPSNNSIPVSAHSTQNFLNYIGKCPVKCYQYKWDNEQKAQITEQKKAI